MRATADGPWGPVGPIRADHQGKMQLLALREAGRVVDFTWASVNEVAARLWHCDPVFLIGKSLRALVAGPAGHPALIGRYGKVLQHGNTQSFEQIHRVDGRQDIVVHRVARLGDGVEITLTNLSQAQRERAASLGEAVPA